MAQRQDPTGALFRPHARLSALAAFRRLWPMIRTDRFLLAGTIGLQAVSVGCDTAAIQVFSVITDKALTAGNPAAFWGPAAIWLAVALIGAATTYLAGQLSSVVAEGFSLRCRDQVFAHAQRLPPHFYDDHTHGDLLTRLTSDVDQAEHLVASGPVQLLNTAFSLVFFAGAALWLRWELALLTFAAAPVFWLAARRLSSRIRAVARTERDTNGALVGTLDENLANMALVQAYNRQDSEWKKVHHEGAAWMRTCLDRSRLANLYGPLANVIESVAVLAVVGAGAWEIAAGRLSVGGLLAFAAYLGYLYPQVQSLGGLAVSLSSATAAGERVFEVLQAKPAVADPLLERPAPATAGPRTAGVVVFENVAFTYPGTGRKVLDGLNFTAFPGQLIRIAGPSGAGKSTLAKLLLRFYDPRSGRILLDGENIRLMPLHDLRDKIALVSQEPMVFDGTIRENIAYGRPTAAEDEIRQAALTADVDGPGGYVHLLPDGYDTRIGPGGRLLSGGQRQRLSLARALLRDTPVLVLDEPTTGLDGNSARRIMEPLRRLMASRTTFLITHDPWLAEQADTVLDITARDTRQEQDRQDSARLLTGSSGGFPTMGR